MDEILVSNARRSFSRLTRFMNKLMRDLMAHGPVTPQQCYALEALVDGPLSMRPLATQVGLHQSTLTRVVEKLERLGLVKRTRRVGNQRHVEVELTDEGRHTYELLDMECNRVIAGLLELIPAEKRSTMVESTEALAALLDPDNERAQELIRGCCGRSGGDP